MLRPRPAAALRDVDGVDLTVVGELNGSASALKRIDQEEKKWSALIRKLGLRVD